MTDSILPFLISLNALSIFNLALLIYKRINKNKRTKQRIKAIFGDESYTKLQETDRYRDIHIDRFWYDVKSIEDMLQTIKAEPNSIDMKTSGDFSPRETKYSTCYGSDQQLSNMLSAGINKHR